MAPRSPPRRGISPPPVPRRQRRGRPCRHRRHRRRAPRAARRRRARDARRRRRLGAADRRARRRRRPLSLASDRTGSGPVLVLLHPLGADRHVWAPVTERLAAEREVIAFDLPGFGESRSAQWRRPADPRRAGRGGRASLPPGGPHHVAGTRSAAGSRSSCRRPCAVGHRDRPGGAGAAGAQARRRARPGAGRAAAAAGARPQPGGPPRGAGRNGEEPGARAARGCAAARPRLRRRTGLRGGQPGDARRALPPASSTSASRSARLARARPPRPPPRPPAAQRPQRRAAGRRPVRMWDSPDAVAALLLRGSRGR